MKTLVHTVAPYVTIVVFDFEKLKNILIVGNFLENVSFQVKVKVCLVKYVLQFVTFVGRWMK